MSINFVLFLFRRASSHFDEQHEKNLLIFFWLWGSYDLDLRNMAFWVQYLSFPSAPTGLLLGLLFKRHDGGHIFLRNVGLSELQGVTG
jgi:hypothetical protein